MLVPLHLGQNCRGEEDVQNYRGEEEGTVVRIRYGKRQKRSPESQGTVWENVAPGVGCWGLGVRVNL